MRSFRACESLGSVEGLVVALKGLRRFRQVEDEVDIDAPLGPCHATDYRHPDLRGGFQLK